MHSRMLGRASAALLITASTGCLGPFAPCRNDLGRFAVRVTVVDARSGDRPGTRATLTLSDGAYTETVPGPDPASGGSVVIPAAVERPGTYSVEVAAAGYQPWRRSDINVTRGGPCRRLRTADLTARLIRVEK